MPPTAVQLLSLKQLTDVRAVPAGGAPEVAPLRAAVLRGDHGSIPSRGTPSSLAQEIPSRTGHAGWEVFASSRQCHRRRVQNGHPWSGGGGAHRSCNSSGSGHEIGGEVGDGARNVFVDQVVPPLVVSDDAG